MSQRVFAGPGHPVDRTLHEGDEVGGFTVLEAPGHSAGHICNTIMDNTVNYVSRFFVCGRMARFKTTTLVN